MANRKVNSPQKDTDYSISTIEDVFLDIKSRFDNVVRKDLEKIVKTTSVDTKHINWSDSVEKVYTDIYETLNLAQYNTKYNEEEKCKIENAINKAKYIMDSYKTFRDSYNAIIKKVRKWEQMPKQYKEKSSDSQSSLYEKTGTLIGGIAGTGLGLSLMLANPLMLPIMALAGITGGKLGGKILDKTIKSKYTNYQDSKHDYMIKNLYSMKEAIQKYSSLKTKKEEKMNDFYTRIKDYAERLAGVKKYF